MYCGKIKHQRMFFCHQNISESIKTHQNESEALRACQMKSMRFGIDNIFTYFMALNEQCVIHFDVRTTLSYI